MPPVPRTADETQAWLIGRVAEELRIAADQIRADQPLVSYGMDSVRVVSVMAHLEDWADIRFSGNPLDDHPTIEQLSRFVAELTRSPS
jgi:acyl carrier protein